MTSEPLVTCIVTVWNGEAYLTKALDSIFAQSYRAFEVIVIDDGSSDRSCAMIAAETRPLRFIRQENTGAIIARNRGIAAAAGDFIAFLDHDDIWAPQKLERQIALAGAADYFACIGLVQEFHEDDSGRFMPRGAPVVGNLPSTFMLSRRAINLVGPLNPALRYADTPEWILRARSAGLQETILHEIVTYRRRHARNDSQLRNFAMRREYLGILKANLDRNRQAAAAQAAAAQAATVPVA
jgi:glycosyltransferase involved in cell wall biosynthesis